MASLCKQKEQFGIQHIANTRTHSHTLVTKDDLCRRQKWERNKCVPSFPYAQQTSWQEIVLGGMVLNPISAFPSSLFLSPSLFLSLSLPLTLSLSLSLSVWSGFPGPDLRCLYEKQDLVFWQKDAKKHAQVWAHCSSAALEASLIRQLPWLTLMHIHQRTPFAHEAKMITWVWWLLFSLYSHSSH